MKKFLRRCTDYVDAALRLVERVLVALVMVMLIVMTVSIFYMVLGRFFQLPWRGGWANETSQYLMVYIAFLPASYILRNSGHVALDILFDRVSRGQQQVMTLVSTLIGAITTTIFAVFATQVVWSAWQRDLILRGAIDMPRYLAVLPIAIGLTMIAMRLWNSFVFHLATSQRQSEAVGVQ